jgi:branched-chain amino acid transport system ATP-binding protein
MLRVENLESGYGSMQVLWKIDLEVQKGTITALLGPNGVGKSTTLMSILGSIRPWGGKIYFEGQDVTHLPSHKKVELGLTLVPEGRHVFPNLTVRENILMGAYTKRASKLMKESLDLIYSLFPLLKERPNQKAGTLSGGQQQMLTIARSLMARPKFLMLDEPSQGLAPKLVGDVFETILKVQKDLDLTLLLVEQNVDLSLEIASYVYIMHEGLIKAEGTSEEIRHSDEVRIAYLGV